MRLLSCAQSHRPLLGWMPQRSNCNCPVGSNGPSKSLSKYGCQPKNNGKTPKSSILIGFSIINHPFWGTPIFGNTRLDMHTLFHLWLCRHAIFGTETYQSAASSVWDSFNWKLNWVVYMYILTTIFPAKLLQSNKSHTTKKQSDVFPLPLQTPSLSPRVQYHEHCLRHSQTLRYL